MRENLTQSLVPTGGGKSPSLRFARPCETWQGGFDETAEFGGIVDAALPFFALTFFKDNLFNF